MEPRGFPFLLSQQFLVVRGCFEGGVTRWAAFLHGGSTESPACTSIWMSVQTRLEYGSWSRLCSDVSQWWL